MATVMVRIKQFSLAAFASQLTYPKQLNETKRVINLSHYEVLQLKRGEQIRIQFQDTILILAGEKKKGTK